MSVASALLVEVETEVRKYYSVYYAPEIYLQSTHTDQQTPLFRRRRINRKWEKT